MRLKPNVISNKWIKLRIFFGKLPVFVTAGVIRLSPVALKAKIKFWNRLKRKAVCLQVDFEKVVIFKRRKAAPNNCGRETCWFSTWWHHCKMEPTHRGELELPQSLILDPRVIWDQATAWKPDISSAGLWLGDETEAGRRRKGRDWVIKRERERKASREVLESSNLSDDECVSHYCSDTGFGEMI